jgi:hypothetical protein
VVKLLATIAERAAAANLPFLVIGGNALIAYGYPRMTRDIGLLVREKDRPAWDNLLTSLGYASRPGPSHRFERDISDVITLIQVNDAEVAKSEYAEMLDWTYKMNEKYAVGLPLDDAYWAESLAGKNPEPFVM